MMNNINANAMISGNVKRKVLGDVTNKKSGINGSAFKKNKAGCVNSKKFGLNEAKVVPMNQTVNAETVMSGMKKIFDCTKGKSRDIGTKKLVNQEMRDSPASTMVAHRIDPFGKALLPSTASNRQSILIDNIDAADSNDPLCATEYVEEIFQSLRDAEISTSPRPDYMKTQTQISQDMRAILIDWLSQVHSEEQTDDDTLYLTVHIIDRFLAKSKIKRNELQLVGVAAFLIASKYEEIYPLEVSELVDLCAHCYSRHEIITMEGIILRALSYRISVPTANKFLGRFLKASRSDEEMDAVANYLLLESLQNYRLGEYFPSQLAAASVMIARKTLKRDAWSPKLYHYSGYKTCDIKPVAQAILSERAKMPNNLLSIKKIYHHVSSMSFKMSP